MDIITSASNNRPYEHTPLHGPTVTLYRSNIEEVTDTIEGPEGTEPYTYYRYTEIRFQPGEYDLVRQGILPTGADAWTEDLRRIERSALYDSADAMIAKANDYATDEWTAYAESVKAYKRAVRDTVNQPSFPEAVEYPDMPTI